MVKKQNEDPSNTHIRLQIRDVQKHILSLGEIQKQLIQRLRKELEANSTNSTLNASKPKTVTNKAEVAVVGVEISCSDSSDSSKAGSNRKNGHIHTRALDIPAKHNGDDRLSNGSSPSGSHSSEDGQDCEEKEDTTVSLEKINFFQAIGLITREILSELQNRRVERKRRSTANHNQFVYGNGWDSSKRKKNGYLLSATSPPTTRKKNQLQQHKQKILLQEQQKQKQQELEKHHHQILPKPDLDIMIEKREEYTKYQKENCDHSTASLKMEDEVSVSAVPCSAVLATQSSSTLAAAGLLNAVASSKSSSKPLLLSSGNTVPSASRRLASLPASLTIERINSPPQTCIICHSSGMLSVCKNCSINFHPSCSNEASSCPKCNTKQGSGCIDGTFAFNSTAGSLIIQQTAVPCHIDLRERKEEKEHLEQLNSRLKVEKSLMEKRAAELTISLEVSPQVINVHN